MKFTLANPTRDVLLKMMEKEEWNDEKEFISMICDGVNSSAILNEKQVEMLVDSIRSASKNLIVKPSALGNERLYYKALEQARSIALWVNTCRG